MRSVTHMFDSLVRWFTPERRDALAFPADIALAVVLAIVSLSNARNVSFSFFLFTAAVTGLFCAGVALHRVAPGAALAFLAVTPLAMVGSAQFGAQVSGSWYAAGAIVLFGSAAWGSRVVRSFGLAVAIIMSLALAMWVFIGGASVYAGPFEIATYFASPILAWVLGELVRSIRNRRALSAAVETVSTERDAALTRADLEAERTRVARDVHDIVAHSLTVVIAQADGARYATTADSPAAADAFGTIAQTARDALADVRTLLTELRHTQEAGPQPGIQNLDALVDSFRDSGLTLTVHEFGDRGGLTDTRELALYRIVQESLTNALRHGDGAATLDLDWGDDTVDLLVTNVAAAPAPASADAAFTVVTHGEHQPERGHGIDGMRERAILAGGEFSIREGATFRVRARLPREPREHSQPEAATPDTIDTEVLA